MKSLLRSVFVVDSNDNPDLMLRNFQALKSSGLGFDVPEHSTIWSYTQEFVRTHNHVPNLSTLRSHFEHARDTLVLDQLKMLEGTPSKVKGDFQKTLEDKVSDRRQRMWAESLKEASVIATVGMEVVDGTERKLLRGPVQSARFLMDKAHDIVAPIIGGRLSGEVTRDGVAVKEEYERVKTDPLAGIGQFAFLQQMDEALSGAKKQELWIHAAFTGGMKSSLMLNWAYNQAVIYKHNSLIFSLEMPYQQCRRILYSMHSMHPKFRQIRMQLGLQPDPNHDLGLPYIMIRDGKLEDWNPNAEKFYFDYVIPDFNGEKVVDHPYFDCDYGNIHIEVADPDKDDFTMPDLRSMAETIYADDPFSMIFVDHCGLMSPRKRKSNTTEAINEVIRDLKKLALGFNRGQGMAVVGLFQISREGYKAALKQKEKTGQAGYNLTHLSYANECCKYSESLIFFDGVRAIETAEVGDQVWSSTGWKTVRHVFDQGERPIWRVVTDRGSSLECTHNHRVRVAGEGALAWKRVDCLSVGDFVVSSSKVPEDLVKVCNSDDGFYPVLQTFLRVTEILGCENPDMPYLTRGVVSKQDIFRVLAQAKEQGVWDDDFEYLRFLVEDLLVMRVSSVGPTGEIAKVYDIEVDGDHEYQSGPLLSHNCERSADVVTSTWIDDELRVQNRVQLNCLKSRDQAPFEPFMARVEWPTRRLLSCSDLPMTTEERKKLGAELDKISSKIEEG